MAPPPKQCEKSLVSSQSRQRQNKVFMYCTEIPSVKQAATDSTETKLATDLAPASVVQRVLYVDEESEVVQKSQLEPIASSSEIQMCLKDENLQKLIQDIDSSSNVDNLLDKAMESDEFRIFTEKILSAIGA
ncbi:hypothetical protein ACFE04_030136 [Oxalis oulophora]